MSLTVIHDAALTHEHHTVEQLEHFRRRLQQRDNSDDAQLVNRSSQHRDDVTRGGGVQAGADLICTTTIRVHMKKGGGARRARMLVRADIAYSTASQHVLAQRRRKERKASGTSGGQRKIHELIRSYGITRTHKRGAHTEEEGPVVAHQHLANSDSLPLPAGHAPDKIVTDNSVRSVLQSEQLDDGVHPLLHRLLQGGGLDVAQGHHRL